MKEKTDIQFLAQDISKLTEIVDYLIYREIDDGADNLEYISNILGSLCVSTQTLVKLVEKNSGNL